MTFSPVNTPRLNGKTIRESLVLTPWNQVTWQPGPIKTWIPGGTDFWWPDLVYFVFLVFFVRFFALFFFCSSPKNSGVIQLSHCMELYYDMWHLRY